MPIYKYCQKFHDRCVDAEISEIPINTMLMVVALLAGINPERSILILHVSYEMVP